MAPFTCSTISKIRLSGELDTLALNIADAGIHAPNPDKPLSGPDAEKEDANDKEYAFAIHRSMVRFSS